MVRGIMIVMWNFQLSYFRPKEEYIDTLLALPIRHLSFSRYKIVRRSICLELRYYSYPFILTLIRFLLYD